LVNTVLVLHDFIHYDKLPAEYRNAIDRLEDDWHYAGLASNEQDAVLQMHKKWQSRGLLPWWGADPLVDLDEQKMEALENFRKFVPLWGTGLHQRHPFWVVLLSLGGFMPLLIYLGLFRWMRWLRSPESNDG